VLEYNNNIPADWIETTPTKAGQILDILSSKLRQFSVPIEREYA
jgi:hypothetical protein